jgi:hypothetical protein
MGPDEITSLSSAFEGFNLFSHLAGAATMLSKQRAVVSPRTASAFSTARIAKFVTEFDLASQHQVVGLYATF